MEHPPEGSLPLASDVRVARSATASEEPSTRSGGRMRYVRRWWPALLIAGASLAVHRIGFKSRYDVAGHAAEHLAGAGAPFVTVGVLGALFVVVPIARRQVWIVLTAAAWLVASIVVLIGNTRVVDALVEAGLRDASFDEVPAEGPVEVAHALANAAPLWAAIAAVALTVAMYRHRHVSLRVALTAGVLTLLLFFILPGFGVIVLVAACVAAEVGPRAVDQAASAT